jgi:hypothetical protein
MPINYSKYKFTDYLEDDFFIQTMISPTKDSKLFWEKLIDERNIDVNEFISANIILETMQKEKQDISQERIDLLWKRIDASCIAQQKKSKYIHLYRRIAIAGCILALVGTFLSLIFGPEESTKIVDSTKVNRFNTIVQQHDNEIRIFADNKQLTISGKNAEVKYDSQGALAVNNEHIYTADTVKQHPEATPEKVTYNSLCVPYGKRASLLLSDGTKLWINAGTTVNYPVVFPQGKREIYVMGEIYAEVAKDESKPFTFKTDNLELVVHGTAFNLTSYKDDMLQRVVLVNGVLDVKQNGQKTQLSPNQLYSCNNEGFSVETVDVETYTSWRDGIYIFRDEPIENILLQLARYYNITMILPQQPSGTFCSGKLELKEELPQLMNGLTEIALFNYAVKDNQYRVQFTK